MPSPVLPAGVGAFAASHHAVLSVRQAADLGLSATSLRDLLEAGAVIVAAPGVLLGTWAPRTWQQRLAVATTTANGCAVVSHRSAARLHGIDGFADVDLVEVTVPKGRRLRVPGAVVHQSTVRSARADVAVVDGLRVTSLARTVVDLASSVEQEELVRLLDDVERRGASTTWLRATAARVHRPGQRGTKRLVAELDRRAGAGRVADSWFERVLAECLRSPRIPPLSAQHDVLAPDGTFVARLDLAVPGVRLGVEAHSRRFHTGEHRERADERRDNRLAEHGWDVRYLGWHDAIEPASAVAMIERVVTRRAADLGVDLAALVRAA